MGRKVQLVLTLEATVNSIEWSDKELTENAVAYLEHIIRKAEESNGAASYELNTGEDGATLYTLPDFLADLKDGVIKPEPAHCRACGATDDKPHHDDGDDPIVVRINAVGLCQCCARGQAQILATLARHTKRGVCHPCGVASYTCGTCETALKIKAERETRAAS